MLRDAPCNRFKVNDIEIKEYILKKVSLSEDTQQENMVVALVLLLDNIYLNSARFKIFTIRSVFQCSNSEIVDTRCLLA